MGLRGREWMKSDYSWSQIAVEMIAEYEHRIQSVRHSVWNGRLLKRES
jgi:hypothetical protein